jgi:hypothetical protein
VDEIAKTMDTFPNKSSVVRLVGAPLLEQKNGRRLQRRYKQLEGLGALKDDQPARLSALVG